MVLLGVNSKSGLGCTVLQVGNKNYYRFKIPFKLYGNMRQCLSMRPYVPEPVLLSLLGWKQVPPRRTRRPTLVLDEYLSRVANASAAFIYRRSSDKTSQLQRSHESLRQMS